MAITRVLREDVFRQVCADCRKRGIDLFQMDFKEKNALLIGINDIWIDPDSAAKGGIDVVCPICLEKMEFSTYPLDPLKRQFARHKKGGGLPLCKDLVKGRIRSISLGIDLLFRIKPKQKKTNGPDPKPVKIKDLKDFDGCEVYALQDPYAVDNGVVRHHIFLLEKSNDEKLKALCDLDSKMDAVLGVPESNGQVIVEARNKTEQPDRFLKKDIVTFYTVDNTEDPKCEMCIDVKFRDEIEYDKKGNPMDRLQKRILDNCALPEQHDPANDIVKIYPNIKPVLIKGIYHKKKVVCYTNKRVAYYKVDVYSDDDIKVCQYNLNAKKDEKQ